MVETKKRLGRGLDSLLSSTKLQEQEIPANATKMQQQPVNETTLVEGIREIPIDKIHKNPHQPRQIWDEDKLAELADSIRKNGLVQPILVRQMGDGYQLIAGERRMRAMRKAGRETISAIIKNATEEQTVEWALIENIHRADLSPLERAQAYQNYINNFSLTQAEAAERLGEERSNIANYMRLLELPTRIKQMIHEGAISMGHARALVGVKNQEQQWQLARKVENEKWSVRKLEMEIKKLQNYAADNEQEKNNKSPHILELERTMSGTLGTKVMIKPTGKSKKRGKIIIEYYSLDDFDRILERLG